MGAVELAVDLLFHSCEGLLEAVDAEDVLAIRVDVVGVLLYRDALQEVSVNVSAMAHNSIVSECSDAKYPSRRKLPSPTRVKDMLWKWRFVIRISIYPSEI